MRALPGLACILVVAATGGCGGDSPDSDSPAPATSSLREKASPKSPSTTQPPPEPSPVELAGTPAPEALSNFRCQPIQGGWAAAGSLTNTGKQGESFQVTVYVGPADGATRQAVTRRFEGLEPAGVQDFRFDRIVAEGDECRVQVLKN